ncbi:MAG: hypothetical protein WCT30_05295 [Desulfurivibrionaceae bacterium]|jgi:hypothetical protein
MMYKGEPISGSDFFRLLYADDKFCAELGRAVLAAGRLESILKQYIAKHAAETNTSKAALGELIKFARKHTLLHQMLPALETLKDQRNYLTHNIHALLSGLVEETILEGYGLLDSDIHTYTELAWQLKENLNGLADIINEKYT